LPKSETNIIELNLQSLQIKGGQQLLGKIEFKLSAEDTVYVCGPNGAGKSSLLRALAGLLPFKGEYRLNNKDFFQLSPSEVSKLLSWVPQTFEPPASYLVEDYLSLSLDEKSFNPEHTLLETANLKNLLKRRLDTLSGGELRKVMVVTAILEPSLLMLLDEPEAHLDPKNSEELDSLLEQSGKAKIIASHNLEKIHASKKNTLGLRDGRLVFFKKTPLSKELEELYELENSTS